MKVVVVGHGGRGDVEPCVAAGRELLRRGHDVLVAVPPNMLEFVELVGLAAIAYGRWWRTRVSDHAGSAGLVCNRDREGIEKAS